MASTIDRRRILGPANARELIFAPLPEGYLNEEIDQAKEDDIKSQISRTFIKTGLITNSNGSAYLEVDGNIINVSVYGPRPIRGTFVEQTSVNVNLDDNTGVIDKLVSQKICDYIDNNFTSVINLKNYPKSTIDIFINIISVQDIEKLSLKLLSLISDTTTLALINSGIEIIDIVASSFDYKSNTLASFIKNGEIVGILSESATFLDDLEKNILNLQEKSVIVKSALVNALLEKK